MTDTSKYEGHTPGPWLASKELPTGWAVITGDDDWILRVDENNKGQLMSEADARLIADAPLLLAEVERLRKQLLQGVMYMHMTVKQTKDGRRHYAKKFERQVREMIE